MIEYSRKSISNWTRVGSRRVFGTMMADIVEADDNTIVLAADVASSSGLSAFAEKYPDKFYNVGIAEQNMVAVAAGLAKEGYNVFIVSFAPFVSLRVQEAVKILIGYMNLSVKIVALSSGVALGVQGNTHFCIEDIALMRTIPGMRVLSPADCCEMAKCLEYANHLEGPAYIRLTGLAGSQGVYKDDYIFDINAISMLRNGTDVAILATGCITAECIRAARTLKNKGISCAVYNVCSLKPLNEKHLRLICEEYKAIVTVEEHSVIGGLGSMVGDYLLETHNSSVILKIGINDEFLPSGDYSYVLEEAKLSEKYLSKRIEEFFKELSIS